MKSSFEMGLALNSIGMLLDDKTYKACKPFLDTLSEGLGELYKKLEELEDDGK